MFVSGHSEAGCAKCHIEIADIARFEGRREGEKINHGRHLFTNLGCINCHQVESLADSRKVGPDLSSVASKLTSHFMHQWVFFPQKFRASTRMPHFFLQENTRAESANQHDPDPVLRTETEVAAMVKYLLSVSKDWEPIPVPEGITGDVERGRWLFKQVGCAACHSNIAEFGEEWITKDIARRKGIDEQTANYQFKGMPLEERVRYAQEHFPDEEDSFLRPDAVRLDPNRPYTKPIFTRFAPDLSGIGSKVTFEWLYSWLIQPTHYAPDTKMPSLRLTPAEAADVAAYLMTLRNDAFPQREFEMNEKRWAMGDRLLMTLLMAQRSERHSRAILKDQGAELGDMIVSLLKSSMGEGPAVELVRSLSPEDKKLVFLGNKMIAHYGCYACHKIRGFEETTPPGTDLTKWAEKPLSQLDFAFYDDAFHDVRERKEEIFGHVYPLDADELNYWSPGENPREQVTHTHGGFAKHKMLNPRIWDREKIKKPYDKLKMPNFYLSNREAEALTTYLLSRRSARVWDTVKVRYETETDGPIAQGRLLTRELNCIGCHEIEDNVPTIQQYYRRDDRGLLTFDALNAPPSLWGEGAKVQHNWLHGFLQDVVPLRPWLNVRMPSFNLTNQQAAVLTEYFAALSRDDAARLKESLVTLDEFRKQQEKAEEENERKKAPPWFEADSLSRVTQRLRCFAAERKLIRRDELDPLRTASERFAEAHAKMLERVRFIQKLYDVPYPFVEPRPPLSPTERFEKGFRFFQDMGCLKCHVLGDMVRGPAANTDQFVQVYRLDAVRGEGDAVVAILNGQPYPVGSVIDGHKLLSATNVYYATGDMETKALFEGPNLQGETERIALSAPSAPNLALTFQRLRRGWVFQWMLEPNWIQPGTKMPQNFPGGKSPFEGQEQYPGTGPDHVNLLVDFLYDAGFKNFRADLVKSVISAKEEAFEEGGVEEFEE